MTRLVAKNARTINRTLLIVARKGQQDMSDVELKNYIVDFIKESFKTLREAEITDQELSIFLQAIAMCAITKKKPPKNSDPKTFFQLNLIRLANEALKPLLRDINVIQADRGYKKYETKQCNLMEYM